MITRSLAAVIAIASVWLAPLDSRAQAAPNPDQAAIESEILALMGVMRSAAEHLDAPALYAHVLDTDTPPIIEDGELRLTLAAALQSTTEGLRGLASLSYAYSKEAITVLSPNTVLWVGSGTATATLHDGREIVAPFAESIVLVKSESEWKVLHAHRSAPK